MTAKDRTDTANEQSRMLASVFSGVVAYAVARGISLDTIIAETGIEAADLIEPGRRIPEQRMPRLWRLLATTFPDEVVGLEMARIAPVHDMFGPIGNAIRFASDIRTTLLCFSRYQGLLSANLEIHMIERPPEMLVTMHHPMDLLDDGFAAEMGLAVSYRIVREHLEVEGSIVRVEFSHQPHGPQAAYETFFEAPVVFGQPANALVIHQDWLDRPIRPSQPELLEYVFAHLDQALKTLQTQQQSRELTRVREAIAEDAKRQQYSAASLAKRLGMSERSLHRLTKSHQTTVQTLLDEARRANAEQLLRDPKFSIDEIAQLLGYASERSFRRAFERWTGHSPAQFRRGNG